MLFAAALLLAQTVPQCAAIDAGWAQSGDSLAPGHSFTIDVANGSARNDFRIETAGIYGIALDQAGWIDVSPAGASAPLKSVKHAHESNCSIIKKIVRFELKPGDYRLDLTNLKQARAKVMLVKD